jgi:hypothetical protein
MDGPSGAPLLGYFIASMRPQPGNPYPLYVVCEPGFEGWGDTCVVGRIMLVRGSPQTVGGYGAASRGTLAATPRIGLRDFQTQGIRVHISGAPSGSPAVLLLGLSDSRMGNQRLPFDLTSFGFLGCQLFTSADVGLPVITGTSGVNEGYGCYDIRLPLPTTHNGSFSLFGQWLCLGSGPTFPGGVTAALRWRH